MTKYYKGQGEIVQLSEPATRQHVVFAHAFGLEEINKEEYEELQRSLIGERTPALEGVKRARREGLSTQTEGTDRDDA